MKVLEVLLLLCVLMEVCCIFQVKPQNVVIVHEGEWNGTNRGVRYEVFPSRGGNITAWTKKVCDSIRKEAATGLWDFSMTRNTSWYSKSTTRNATRYHTGAAFGALSAPKGVYKDIQNERTTNESYAYNGSWFHTVGPFSVANMRVAHFQDVVVSARGWIVNVGECFALMNGGCLMGAGFENQNRAYPGNPKPYILPNDKISTMEKRYPTFSKVISIAQSAKTWHFPMENLPALMVFSDEELRANSTVIHVKTLNSVVVEWLKIGLGSTAHICRISGTDMKSCQKGDVKLIVGDIFAKSVMVPEQGLCGHPTREQFAFMRGRGMETVQYLLSNKTAEDPVVTNLTNIADVNDPKRLSATTLSLLKEIYDHYKQHGNFDDYKLVVVMDRTNSRKLAERGAVTNRIKDWCRDHGYAMYLFGDHKRDVSPTVSHQLIIFNAATIVIGPHGGAETNAITMRPLQSCLIEMYPLAMYGLPIRGCYAPMAKSLSIHFYQIDYQEIKKKSGSLDVIDSTLAACLQEVRPDSTRREDIILRANTADTVGE